MRALEQRGQGLFCLGVRHQCGAPARSLFEPLRARIVETASPGGPLELESGFITSLRQERLLRQSLDSLRTGLASLGHGVPHEMLLLDFYAALEALDAITGKTTADDILNRIFSTFCIGK